MNIAQSPTALLANMMTFTSYGFTYLPLAPNQLASGRPRPSALVSFDKTEVMRGASGLGCGNMDEAVIAGRAMEAASKLRGLEENSRVPMWSEPGRAAEAADVEAHKCLNSTEFLSAIPTIQASIIDDMRLYATGSKRDKSHLMRAATKFGNIQRYSWEVRDNNTMTDVIGALAGIYAGLIMLHAGRTISVADQGVLTMMIDHAEQLLRRVDDGRQELTRENMSIDRFSLGAIGRAAHLEVGEIIGDLEVVFKKRGPKGSRGERDTPGSNPYFYPMVKVLDSSGDNAAFFPELHKRVVRKSRRYKR